MKIDGIEIIPHAMKRFRQRHQALTGVQLNNAELIEKLKSLIAGAVPEAETPLLEIRKYLHNEASVYLVNLPWRFVFSRKNMKKLKTCEIIPEEISLVENPHIPNDKEKSRFFLKIKLDRRKQLTQITRSFDKRTLHLQNLIEINALIRALRTIGLGVDQSTVPNHLEIIVPQDIVAYGIAQFAQPDNVLISLNQTNPFPLGRQRVVCQGILKPDLERILSFLQVHNSR